MKTSFAALASVILCFMLVSACDPPVEPPMETPQPIDAPNPEGTGWVVWDTTKYKGTLTGAMVNRNVISLNIQAIHNDGCTPQTTFTSVRNGNTITVKNFFKPRTDGGICIQALTPFTHQIALQVSSGTYRVRFSPSPLPRPFDTTFVVP
ncbi:MAG: hypothetical protein MUF71_08770 [Candidatus Kapabacteria bacterium]|jgi:hypothetical protein|nr:hypothetical protein [Candidatus Kapabacteria bacterium]